MLCQAPAAERMAAMGAMSGRISRAAGTLFEENAASYVGL
jgi:hypothetical protein